MNELAIQPVFVTFVELVAAMRALHQDDKPLIDQLHDIWLMGAPSPDSIIRISTNYDPRFPQAGNVEKRLILPMPMATWIMQVSALRGMPYTRRQALNLIDGKIDIGV